MSILALPFGGAHTARAQSINAYSAGLGNAILILPQCKAVINKGTKALFQGVGSLFGGSSVDPNNISSTRLGFDGGSSGLDELPLAEIDFEALNNIPAPSLDDFAGEASSQLNSIQVSDPAVQKDLKEVKKDLKDVKASTESINADSTCIDSIGRLMIKMVLQKVTVSTVNWINTGFDGSPSFIQDPGKFFGDIAKNEILQFGLEINDPALFPFGKAWMRNTAAAYNSKFQDNARYSLDELIRSTSPSFSAQTFQQSFAQGGWNAWTAMTQNSANNPIGFKLMADNELSQRLAGTVQSTAEGVREGLAQASGFLGDQRCVEPKGLSREQHEKALRGNNLAGSCQRWEYVTPGKLVSEAATTAINYQNNAYLNVEDLNDAVAAILDALLGQFSQNIYEKGFANFGDEGIDGTLALDYTNVNDPYKTQAEKDFNPVHLGSSWLKSNPNFDIRTDLNQALIDTQRTYSDKLLAQNKELLSTTDGGDYKIDINTGISNAWGLLPAIYQLDYCIPGPHPGWFEDSQRALNAATAEILPETEQSLKNRNEETIVQMASVIGPLAGIAAATAVMTSGVILGATIGTAFVPIVGTAVGAAVGIIVGGIVGLFTKDKGNNSDKVRLYYATTIQSLTGIESEWKNGADTGAARLENKQGVIQALNEILRRYAQKIEKFYNTDFLPNVHVESAANFFQLDGYGKMMVNNDNKVALLRTTIGLLGEIKEEVDMLNEDYQSEVITEEEYEALLKEKINAFGRLSSSMVSGDDIATADNLLKQIKDKRAYVYNSLLKGEFGCEADLEKERPEPLPTQVTNTMRMNYPFPIIYDYNKVTKGATLPDPWKSGDSNTMTFNTSANAVGPGFLSYVFFQSDNNFNHFFSLAKNNGQGTWISDSGSDGKSGTWTMGKDTGTWEATKGVGGNGTASFDSTTSVHNQGTWTAGSGNSGTWISHTGKSTEKGEWINNIQPFNVVYQETFCKDLDNRNWCMIDIAGVLPLASTQSTAGRGPSTREPADTVDGRPIHPEYKKEINSPWTGGQFEASIGIY